MTLQDWKDYIYHPPLLDNYKLGFKFGQKYPPGFGRLTGVRHLGQDYLIGIGKPIYAITNGRTKSSKGIQAGNMVELTTNKGLRVRYMHLNSFTPLSNSTVSKGQIIGYTGNTGFSTAPHLHLDISPIGTSPSQFEKFIDPLSLNYSTTMPEQGKPQEFNFQGKEFQTRIFENYEILLAYPVLFIANKYGYKDGEFAWNDKGGFRDFIRWWAQFRSKEQFKKAIEADYQTWQKEQK